VTGSQYQSATRDLAVGRLDDLSGFPDGLVPDGRVGSATVRSAALLGPTPRSSHGASARHPRTTDEGRGQRPRPDPQEPTPARRSPTQRDHEPHGRAAGTHRNVAGRAPRTWCTSTRTPAGTPIRTPCNVGLIRRDPPDFLAGLADRSPPRGLAHVCSAAERRPGAAALDVRGSMGQQHPCAAVARYGVGEDARRAADPSGVRPGKDGSARPWRCAACS
jgi:hypothetical protein